MTPTLETARLWLRPLQLSDADQIQILFPNWDIVRHLAARVPWPYPPDGAQTYCRDIALPVVERGAEWHWTLWLKQDPAPMIGTITLIRGEEHNRGFWLGLPWQGRGLMSEACDVVTD
ncbi:MAG: GNAT family N-acetyltransferase [Terriglobales bacterium]